MSTLQRNVSAPIIDGKLGDENVCDMRGVWRGGVFPRLLALFSTSAGVDLEFLGMAEAALHIRGRG